MAVYTHKDIKVAIGDAEVCCSSLSINNSAPLEPLFSIDKSVPSEIKNTKERGGSVKLQYYLTEQGIGSVGTDPILTYIASPGTHIPVKFAGLSISSGYLVNYSLTMNQYAFATATADIKFYEDVAGTFTPVKSTILPSELEILRSTNAEIEGGKSFSKDNVKSLSYSYQCEIVPVFHAGSTALQGVTRGRKKIDSKITVYGSDLSLPQTGIKENFKINLKDKNSVTKRSFVLDGVLSKKDTSYQVGGAVTSTYEVGSAKLGALEGGGPSISSLSITQGAPANVAKATAHSQCTIGGNNFLNIDRVLVGEFPCEIISSNEAEIVFEISPYILSGYAAPVRVVTEGGEENSRPVVFHVTGGLTDMHGF